MKNAPYFKFVGDPLDYNYYGIGVAKGHPEFVDYINQWLTDIKKNGKWKELYKKIEIVNCVVARGHCSFRVRPDEGEVGRLRDVDNLHSY